MSGLAIPKAAISSPAPSSLALPGALARRPSQLSQSTVPGSATPTAGPSTTNGDIKPVTQAPPPVIVVAGSKDEDEDGSGDEDGTVGKGKKRKIGAGTGDAATAVGAGAGVKDYKYAQEICQMMFVFGEVQGPLPETVKLVEDIVRGQIVEIITRARQLTHLRGSRFLSADDVIFLIRDDRGKVNRLRTYLSWKDVRKKAKDDESGEAGAEVEVDDAEKVTARIRKTMVKLPWEVLTPFSDLMKGLPSRQNRAEDDEEQDEDEMQAYQDTMQRLRDADELTRKMTKEEYIHFSECRQASFTFRKSKRFREFVNFSAYLDVGPNDDIVDILGFLAFEMVRTLTVKSLDIRDRMERSIPKPTQATVGSVRRNTLKQATAPATSLAGTKRKSTSPDEAGVVQTESPKKTSPEGMVISPGTMTVALPSTSQPSTEIQPPPPKRTKTLTDNPKPPPTAVASTIAPVSLFAPPPSARQPLLPLHILEAFAQIQREQGSGRTGGMRNFRGGVMRGRLALV